MNTLETINSLNGRFKKYSSEIDNTKIKISDRELSEISSFNEQITEFEIRNSYLPIIELILINDFGEYSQDKNTEETKIQKSIIPLMIGIAGSVSVGKSTFSKTLKKLFHKFKRIKNVEIVTTDGFLYPNSVLEKKKIMDKKGFPESYDHKSLLKFLHKIKSGASNIEAPIYSHNIYDILEGKRKKIDSPKILILEGVNVLNSSIIKFFDFSIYLDADEDVIKNWYIKRFLSLRHESLSDKNSYFKKYNSMTVKEVTKLATNVWKTINLKNLNDHILPTRNNASLIVKKKYDHSIKELWLRET
tara:strand:+ start:106 stop:1014 length:909 start_codon:yes stop_codon:yes gene_type:complete